MRKIAASQQNKWFVGAAAHPYVGCMNIKHEHYNHPRVDAMIREARIERSVYMGETIGNMLAIAWEGLEAAGAWLRRALPGARRKAQPQ